MRTQLTSAQPSSKPQARCHGLVVLLGAPRQCVLPAGHAGRHEAGPRTA